MHVLGLRSGKGDGTVDPAWFYGAVDYTPYLTSDPIPAAPELPEEMRLPEKYALSPGYPNPFNPSITVPYAVPPPGGKVSVVIYNVLGQRVVTLLNGPVEPGFHRVLWDGTDERGRRVASGVYYYRLKIGEVEQSKKMVLLKWAPRGRKKPA